MVPDPTTNVKCKFTLFVLQTTPPKLKKFKQVLVHEEICQKTITDLPTTSVKNFFLTKSKTNFVKYVIVQTVP